MKYSLLPQKYSLVTSGPFITIGLRGTLEIEIYKLSEVRKVVIPTL